jgi:hypothetical protein
MKKLALGLAAVAAFAATPAMAADYIFSFSGTNLFGGQPLVGSGTLTTSGVTVQQNGRDAQMITGITGTYNGSAITGLASVTGSDNFYYLTGKFVSGNGLGFVTAAGTNANLFDSAGQYRINTTNPFQSGFVTATSSPAASAVPETATWGMMITGFGMMGAVLRTRRRNTTVTFA